MRWGLAHVPSLACRPVLLSMDSPAGRTEPAGGRRDVTGRRTVVAAAPCSPARRRTDARRAGTIPALDGGIGLLLQRPQKLPAGLLTPSAGLLANAAVLMVVGMPRAFVAAALADGHASLQQRPGDAGVAGRLASHDPESGGAHIGAVPAQPDARDHLGEVLFAQVIVGVGDARLGAVTERVDRCRQHTGAGVQGTWAGVQQLPGVAHGSSAAIDSDTATATLVPLARPGNRRADT